ncbi:hypothetical protein [Agromyces sp. GXS1127]|uniref:hypothetical protein n=1 Tax=Agromyces sp. GXS1127 TaxID=3424181 RepID=UPI003D3178CF
MIQLRDGDVELGPGDVFVVPRGVEHCPKADGEVSAILDLRVRRHPGISTQLHVSPLMSTPIVVWNVSSSAVMTAW